MAVIRKNKYIKKETEFYALSLFLTFLEKLILNSGVILIPAFANKVKI